jgi:hypothetical protein
MFGWLFGSKCAICRQKAEDARKYFDDQGKAIVVCAKCVMYAERRAFRVRK